jgi:polygalacturonase
MPIRAIARVRLRSRSGVLLALFVAALEGGGCGGSTGSATGSAGSAGVGGGAAGMTGAAGTAAGGSSAAGAGGGATGAAGTGPGGTMGRAGAGAAGSTGAGGRAGTTGGAGGVGGAGAAGTTGTAGGGGTACGAGDPNLPAEPTIPPACTTLAASFVAGSAPPSEASLDTSRIQSALSACGAGKSLELVTSGTSNGFITGPITIPAGVTLWVDAGVTLFGTRDPNVYGSASALIRVTGANSGIVGDGVIDGQGGEPKIGGTQSWWDVNGGGGSSPALIQVSGATNFTLYRITLQNSPMFHVKLGANGFVAWGVTIKTPSKSTNSAGTALTYSNAHNTDGIDPGQAASNGFIVCSRISTGDDHIAIKGSSSTGVSHLTIAHNHFEAGHGMSIGSEFTGGVSDINVYDLSIDGTGANTSGGSSNGLRIKSDSSRGGLVNNVTYSDICMRDVSNPIFLTPKYSTMTGSSIPQYTNIKLQNVHIVSGGSNTPKITLDGYDAAHMNSVTLDNVVVDGVSASNVTASYTNVTLGPGNVNFMPSGTNVNVTNAISGSSTPNPCTNKWVTF